MPDGVVPDRQVPADAQDEPVVVVAAGPACTTCGTTSAVARPTTWSLQVADGGVTWRCDVCTRRDLRSIECRLDEAWW